MYKMENQGTLKWLLKLRRKSFVFNPSLTQGLEDYEAEMRGGQKLLKYIYDQIWGTY